MRLFDSTLYGTTIRYLLIVGVLFVSPCESAQLTFADADPGLQKRVRLRFERMTRRGISCDAAADSVVSFLRESGYLDASYVSSTGDSTFRLSAGREYLLTRISLRGDDKRAFELEVPFRKAAVEAVIGRLLDEYHRAGFYYARIRVESVVLDTKGVAVSLNVFKGPRLTAGRRVFNGLERTNEMVIGRYIPIKAGDTLTSKRLRMIESAAASIPFVAYRSPAEIHPQPGYTEADIVFDMSELRQVHLFGGGGIVPDERGGAVWNVDFSLRNPFGGGRLVSVRSERREARRNLLRIEYSQPLFIGGVGELKATVGTRDYRDEFSEFSLMTQYRLRMRESTVTGLILGWKRVVPVKDISGYSRFEVGFRVDRSTIIDSFNPKNGLVLRALLSFAYRRYEHDLSGRGMNGKAFTETRSSLSFAVYKRVTGPVVLSSTLAYLGFETDEQLPPGAELYFVGGPGTIRGYRNEQFTAQRTAFGSFEPRIRLRNGYIFAFLDGAYLNRRILSTPTEIRTEELFRYSYGGGVALRSGARSLKLSLGWNQDAPVDEPRLSIELSSDL